MHEKRPQIPLRPHRLSSFVTSEGQLPLRRQRRLGTLMDVIALRALECSDVKARAAAGDTRQRGVPRQLLHEQVPQARLHQLQRKNRGQQFIAERGLVRQARDQARTAMRIFGTRASLTCLSIFLLATRTSSRPTQTQPPKAFATREYLARLTISQEATSICPGRAKS